jgi:hypothetical protein
MKQIFIGWLSLSLSFGIFSCTKNEPTQAANRGEAPVVAEVPVALQEKSASLSSIKREWYSQDIVEDLYAESQKKNPDLQELETKLKDHRSDKEKTLSEIGVFTGHIENFYSGAGKKTEQIKDSLLRQKMAAILTASQTQFAAQSAELTAALAKVGNTESALEDQHLALKLLIALDMMQKYEKDFLPSTKPIEGVHQTQQGLFKQMEKLTPKK